MQATTAIYQLPCAVRSAHYKLEEARCPRCGCYVRAWSTARRTAIDIDMTQPILLDVTVSVHYCRACHHYFRAQPPFLHRDGIYTKRVMQKSVDAVFKDGMAFRRVPDRLARDFYVRPSEGSIRRWCRLFGETLDYEEYQQWVVNEFSGILCIDEVYQGKLALLLAVDPAQPDGDRLVGYELIDGNVTADAVEQFCSTLKSADLFPEQIITDGSSLYPETLRLVWPRAAHQLCLFHETRHVVRAAMKTINRVRRQVPAPEPIQSGSRLVGVLTDEPPAKGATELAIKRWYWRRLQRHHHIKQVHQLAERGLSQRAIARQTGRHRKTIRNWLSRPIPPLPPDMPADIAQMPIILPEKQQRRVEKQRKVERIHELRQQGVSYAAIGEQVGLHRVTVSKWFHGTQGARDSNAQRQETDAQPPDGWSSYEEVRHIRELLRKHRFLLVRRPDHLSAAEQELVAEMLQSPVGSQLATVKAFMERWYRIWWTESGQRQRPEIAAANYEVWRRSANHLTIPQLNRVAHRFSADRFRRTAQFLKHEHWQATNNGAERMGRTFRHRQAPHFNLRSNNAIRNAMEVDCFLKHQRSQQPKPQRLHYCQRGRRARLPVAS